MPIYSFICANLRRNPLSAATNVYTVIAASRRLQKQHSGPMHWEAMENLSQAITHTQHLDNSLKTVMNILICFPVHYASWCLIPYPNM